MCRKITSHWQPLFLVFFKKMAVAASFSYKIGCGAPVASFSYKIGGGGLIFLQNWRRRRRQGLGPTEYRKLPKTTEYYWKQPNTTENNRILPKNNLS